ncbi:MAG: phosphotransacetylase family protein [Actinomycetota bacterium]
MVCIYFASQVGLSGLHTTCIGLGRRFQEEKLKVGYMKPVGHRYFTVEGRVTDEDAAFMQRTLGLEEDLSDICPVVLTPQVVNAAYMEGTKDLLEQVKQAFGRVSAGKDVVLVQGAYTSQQGRFLGLSAYQLAPVFDARVILVERFDDAFQADNVLAARDDFTGNLMGVIYNIIPSNRESFVADILAPSLERLGIPVLGQIPFDRLLSSINVGDLAELLDGRVLAGEANLDNLVEDIVVGAMSQEHALSVFRKLRSPCVVTGGDRSDIMLAAMEAKARCLILTGNLYPSSIILGKAEELGIPVIMVGMDTFTTAERADMIIRSARTHEAKKLERLGELIDCCVDLPRLRELAGI